MMMSKREGGHSKIKKDLFKRLEKGRLKIFVMCIISDFREEWK